MQTGCKPTINWIFNLEITPTTQPASLIRRLGAIFYDSLILLAILMLGTWLIMPFTNGNPVSPGVLIYQLYLLLLGGFYYVGFWVYCGQTVGMRAWRIKVVNSDGSPLSWKQGTLRAFYALITLLPAGLGLWYMLFNAEKQTWYDRMTHTHVIRHNPV